MSPGTAVKHSQLSGWLIGAVGSVLTLAGSWAAIEMRGVSAAVDTMRQEMSDRDTRISLLEREQGALTVSVGDRYTKTDAKADARVLDGVIGSIKDRVRVVEARLENDPKLSAKMDALIKAIERGRRRK